MGGEDEEVEVGVGSGEGFATEDAGEFGVGEGGAEGGFFGAVADDEPAGGEAEGAELGVDFGEEGYVFFYAEAAYVAEQDVRVVGGTGAASGGEEGGVDAALHEVAGAVGSALEEGAEGGVGGVEGVGSAIEGGGDLEGSGLDCAFEREAEGAEVTREPAHAAGGVFVEIGVPGGDEREVELVGEVGSEEAEFAGAGDVKDVGAEGADGFGDQIRVAEEEGVEAEVLFEEDGEGAAAEFEGLDGAFGGKEAGGAACSDAEHGEVVAAGEGEEVAAGVGDAVDLVVAVGEVGDAGRGGHRGDGSRGV